MWGWCAMIENSTVQLFFNRVSLHHSTTVMYHSRWTTQAHGYDENGKLYSMHDGKRWKTICSTFVCDICICTMENDGKRCHVMWFGTPNEQRDQINWWFGTPNEQKDQINWRDQRNRSEEGKSDIYSAAPLRSITYLLYAAAAIELRTQHRQRTFQRH